MAAYDIIAFDFRKVFDKVSHYKLLEALSSFHLGSNTLAWIGNFLLERSQIVFIGSDSSKPVPEVSGVIQRSILSPTLFTIFLDCLGQVLLLMMILKMSLK